MKPSNARYIVGIDLGTTNCALAYVDLDAEGDLAAHIRDLPIPQLVAPGETAQQRLLPSNAYLPGDQELPAGATKLPWGERPTIVGELAKLRGARVPGRMVSSAKSWLSHAGVDRTAAILPWGAPEGVPRISPVDASALYLAHLRDAWNHHFPDAPLSAQEVVLTVPASFDEVARELTVRAAREAGIGKLTLVEEPQAAFYDWAAKHRGKLDKALGNNRLILVVDVGGGTTDLTLISAEIKDGAPALKRIAVGDHILLGGDNMDVTLARRIEARLGARLDAAQWTSLVQACRLAKESLLSPGGPEKTSVTVVGRSSRLIGGAMSAELTRKEVLGVVLDGFFPSTRANETAAKAGRTGLQELGLPYASEPAVTRHVSAFLRAHAPEVEEALGSKVEGLPTPDAVLLNGGVFAPPEVGDRLAEVIDAWGGERERRLEVLANDALDLAVARGAAYYGLVRRGLGLRIGGGTARAYFIGLDGEKGAQQALCVIPKHLEEETEVEVPRTFGLLLDRPVRFPLYASTLARAEKPGDLSALDEERFSALPPIETVLRSGVETKGKPVEVPVRLRASLTEIGTLELWCVATDRDARWKLEFQLRGGAAEESAPSAVAPMPRRFGEARELIEIIYGKKPAPVDKRDVKNLIRNLEKILGPREGWTTPVIRELWSALHAGMGKRRRSADHERLWCNLTGFCLRPGFGAPLDAWRASETWKVFDQGLQFQNEAHNWEAWWIMWRRIAGGLDKAAQQRLFETIAPVLRPAQPGKSQPKQRGVKPEGVVEIIRLAGSLERIEADAKSELGGWLFERIEKEGPAPHLLWSIGRLGARVPFYGSGHACVYAGVAESWIERLLALPMDRREHLVFPLAQLARVSGDRHRDLDPELRRRVADWLAEAGAPEALVKMVLEVVELTGGDEQRVFGESLPAGLKLLPEPNGEALASGAQVGRGA
ncbi:MAG: Hsp70 family protein [Myxococcales bacterium]